MVNIIPFLSYVFITTFTPGPNNIMSMTNANQYGYKKTFKFTLGVFAGFALVILLCSYFDLLLFNIVPKIKFYMELLGAVYMVYLAYKVFKSGDASKGNKESRTNSFASGLILQFLNPKVILYGLTVASNFIIPYYRSNFMLILFSLLLAIIGFIATTCWAFFGVLYQRFMSKYVKPLNIMMSVLLIYCAVSIFIK